MTNLPSNDQLFRVLDHSWPATEFVRTGPWTLRRGGGGGKRVSAATTDTAVSIEDIALAEQSMREMGQPPLFQLRGGDEDLDTALADRGYHMADPTLLLVGRSEDVAAIEARPLDAIFCTQPLAMMREIWASGGIGAGRLAVMDRASDPKTWLFCRYKDTAAGAAFVSAVEGVAMLHALHIMPEFRRHGVARKVLGRAAVWALEHDAPCFSVVTTGENLPAQGLFASVGLGVVGKYHYRAKEGA